MNSIAALADVPAYQRHRVLSGMRWSVWLSSIAVPFGAAINLLLARVSPETIGVYGLLSVYIGLITIFLYFGGDAVVIKFMPECSTNDDRASFIGSYLFVVLAIIVPWLVLAWFWPAAVRLVLGASAGDRVNFVLLCLAPVPIIFFMVVAALKGMLEIRFSQLLSKLLTISSLLAYGVMFVVARPTLARHPIVAVWGIYLGLAAVLAVVGAVQVFQLCRRPRLRFWLPNGFWRYALDTQQVSLAYFLASRLDYILILNFGGLNVLGRYVAVMAVAATIPMIKGLFVDTLLPSLTNMIATRNARGAAQVFMMHMRILFLVTFAASCTIMVLAVPATRVMGAKYHSLQGLIVVMGMVQGIATPGAVGSVLLSSIGRQRPTVLIGVLHSVILALLFLPMWHRWGLAGGVAAYGLATLISNGLLMDIALRTAPIYPSIAGLWSKAALIQAAVGLAALYWMPLKPIVAGVTWLAAVAGFLWVANYDLSEFKALAQTFAPRFGRRFGEPTEDAVPTDRTHE